MTGDWVNFVHREGEVVVWGRSTAEKSPPDLRCPEFCIPERDLPICLSYCLLLCGKCLKINIGSTIYRLYTWAKFSEGQFWPALVLG